MVVQADRDSQKPQENHFDRKVNPMSLEVESLRNEGSKLKEKDDDLSSRLDTVKEPRRSVEREVPALDDKVRPLRRT